MGLADGSGVGCIEIEGFAVGNALGILVGIVGLLVGSVVGRDG